MKKRLASIVSYLQDQYGAKAIILVGSRVVGDYEEQSDWDFFVFTSLLNQKQIGPSESRGVIVKYGWPALAGEKKLDCYFLPCGIPFSFRVFDKKLRYASVVLDTDGYAKRLLQDAKKFYKRGPEKLDTNIMKIKSKGYLDKFDYLLKNKKYAHLFTYMGWYFNEMIVTYWFNLRGEWELRPQQAFDYIKNEDPKFYRLLKVVFSEKSYVEKVAACKKLHALLFGG